MLEKIKEHPAIAASIIFASGFTFALVVADQLVYRNVQLISDLERRKLDQKAADLTTQLNAAERRAALVNAYERQLTDARSNGARLEMLLRSCQQSSQSAMTTQAPVQPTQTEADFRRKLDACNGALARHESELVAAQNELVRARNAASTTESDLRRQVSQLQNQLVTWERFSKYRGTIGGGSPYPKAFQGVTIGTTASRAMRFLAEYQPELKEGWLDITIPSGPFKAATYYHDQGASDPKITFIVFWFRDSTANDVVSEEAVCGFGSEKLTRRTDGHMLTWSDVHGNLVQITDGGYKIESKLPPILKLPKH